MSPGVPLLVLGLGRMGRAIVRGLLSQPEGTVGARVVVLGDRSGLWVIPDGWTRAMLAEALEFKATGMPLTRWRPDAFGAERIRGRAAYGPGLLWRLDELGIHEGIVVDATGPGAETAPLLTMLARAGYKLVLAGRGPLAGSQASYDALTAAAGARLRAAGLVPPAVSLPALLTRAAESGQPIRAITATPSPALNAILAAVGAGTPFSAAVQHAARAGLLHADLREDLAGHAAGWMTLALARALGARLEPDAVEASGLLPAALEVLPSGEVWARLPTLDATWAARTWAAGERGRVLRYVAHVSPLNASAGVEEVARNSALGRLGPNEMWLALHAASEEIPPVYIQGPAGTPSIGAAAVLTEIGELLAARVPPAGPQALSVIDERKTYTHGYQ